jgi:hypothetical protein
VSHKGIYNTLCLFKQVFHIFNTRHAGICFCCCCWLGQCRVLLLQVHADALSSGSSSSGGCCWCAGRCTGKYGQLLNLLSLLLLLAVHNKSSQLHPGLVCCTVAEC